MSRKRELSCGAVIFRMEDGERRFLVIRQTMGHWCFPKGHTEKHETERETAAREISEETGLTVRFVDGFRHALCYSPKKGVMKDVIYFLAEPTGGRLKLQAKEVSDSRWCTAEEALALVTFENDRGLLRAALAFLNGESEEKA